MQVELYGFGYFHYDWSSGSEPNFQDAGALYVDIVDGSITYCIGHPANFVFQIPAKYQDKLIYQKYDFYGNVKHQFDVSNSVDETELEIPVWIVFKDSMNQARASPLDSIYDPIGEAAGTKTIKWSRGKTTFPIIYKI